MLGEEQIASEGIEIVVSLEHHGVVQVVLVG